MDVKMCLGCDACMRTHAGCVQKDEGMARIYEDLDWCNVVVFASPVHFACMTAQLKAVVDRMWAWFNLPGHFGAKRRTVLISTARGTDYSLALQQYGVYSILGWEDLGFTAYRSLPGHEGPQQVIRHNLVGWLNSGSCRQASDLCSTMELRAA